MKRTLFLVVLLTFFAPGPAVAVPTLRSGNDAPRPLREELLWQRTDAQVGVALGAALLLGGGVAAYETHTMCDDSPDPADDCGTVQGLAWVGSGLLLGLGATFVVWAGLDWAEAQAGMDALEVVPSVGLSVGDDGALLTFEVRY